MSRTRPVTTAALSGNPRIFGSLGEFAGDVAAVVRRAGPLAAVFLHGRLDRRERERIMVAVSRDNACRGCTVAHQRWALQAGVSAEELRAIELGDLAPLDDRSRAAVAYATALAERRFRRPPPEDVAAAAALHLSPTERAAVEAVARLIALANLSASTVETMLASLVAARVRRRRPRR
jgi:AhpD family alkylhydroperoxidase